MANRPRATQQVVTGAEELCLDQSHQATVWFVPPVLPLPLLLFCLPIPLLERDEDSAVLFLTAASAPSETFAPFCFSVSAATSRPLAPMAGRAL